MSDPVVERNEAQAAPEPVPGTRPVHVETDTEVRKRSARMTRRGLFVGAVGAAAGYAGYRWIDQSGLATDDGSEARLQLPLRRAEDSDAKVTRELFNERGIAPTYNRKRAEELRFNGPYGVRDDLDLKSWRLQMAGVANPEKFPQYQKDITTWNYLMTQ